MSAAFVSKAARLLFDGNARLRAGEGAAIGRAVDRANAEPGWEVPTSLVTLVDLRWDEHEVAKRAATSAAKCPECGAIIQKALVIAPIAIECAGGDHVLVFDDGGRVVVHPGGEWEAVDDADGA